MGYQVDNTCYDDRAAAENVYFSKVAPAIVQDGSLKQITYDGKAWHYGSQKLVAQLPECNPAENYVRGYEMMSALLPTVIVLCMGKIVIDSIKGMGS